MLSFERYLMVLMLVAAVSVGPGLAGEMPRESAQAAEPAEEAATAERPLRLDWYGYIKLDAAWDGSLVDSGNFARWVASPSIVEEHSHFNMTSRQTRLGVDLEHTAGDQPPIRAKIEIDFYGGGSENKNRPQLRHAYFDMAWPKSGWTLRAGQTSDVISPLAPTTINYTVAWWAGNIGYRRPMARVSKTTHDESGHETRFTFALSRTIGDDFGTAEPGDSGVDSGVPTVQLAASRSWSLGRDRKATVGVSGHWGKERLEEARGLPAPEFDSWSVNLDLELPVAASGTLKGEAWQGRNLDDYFGAIGQGIDFNRSSEVDSQGGWLAYNARLGPKLAGSVGCGLDDPDDETLPAGARSRNQAVWVNLSWDVRTALSFGVEGSWWQTDYRDLENGASFRLQSALKYTFSG